MNYNYVGLASLEANRFASSSENIIDLSAVYSDSADVLLNPLDRHNQCWLLCLIFLSVILVVFIYQYVVVMTSSLYFSLCL